MGNRIKDARERLIPKTTQKTIGDAFGVTDKAVSAWERSDSIPDLEKIPNLARLLKVPLSWLLEGTGDPPPPDGLETLVDNLSEPERAAVVAMVQSFHARRVSEPSPTQQARKAAKRA